MQGFLYNLFSDPSIIRLPSYLSPLQTSIAWLISSTRSKKAIKAYDSIGGGSPILKYTNEQADRLKEQILERHGLEVETYIGMRYWEPYTSEALKKIYADGIEELVLLPLYPHFSVSTSGSSLMELSREFSSKEEIWGDINGLAKRKTMIDGNGMEVISTDTTPKIAHTVVSQWYERPGYINAMAELLRKELDKYTEEEYKLHGSNERHVLFSAHGVPVSYVQGGDPYQKQIIDCVDLISAEIAKTHPDVKINLSYQSKVGPIDWLEPYTDDVIPELGKKGVKNLVVVPISFVSEHIETLEEIDQEYKELAEENGITNWRRCQALNTDPNFIADLADIVKDALDSPRVSVAQSCYSNNCCMRDTEDPVIQALGCQKERVMSELAESSSMIKKSAVCPIRGAINVDDRTVELNEKVKNLNKVNTAIGAASGVLLGALGWATSLVK